MKVSQAFPSNYLKASDLQGRQPQVTISGYKMETIGDDQKPVVYFQGKEKGLVLNKTNANNIAAAYGDDMDDWQGKSVVLFSAWVDFQGKSVEAIRVRMPKPGEGNGAKPAARQPEPVGDPRGDMDDAIPF